MTDAKDERPLVSESPEWAKALTKEFCDKLEPLFNELWETARQQGGIARSQGKCNAAEAENDALSCFSQVASFAPLLFTMKLAAVKEIELPVALSVALQDTAQRLANSFKGTVEIGVTEGPDEKTIWAAREWLLGQANVGVACAVAGDEANALSERLNERAHPEHPEALTMPSSLVARALAVNAITRTAGDWLAMESGMPAEVAHGVIRSIADDVPDGVAGTSFIKPELVQ
jgi:hypothetical protein